jgi:inhibitor of KinA
LENYNLTYKPFGTSAILIEWPAKIDEKIIQNIISFEKLVAKEQGVVDTIIAYNSLTISYNNDTNYSTHYKYRNSYAKKVQKLTELYVQKRDDLQKSQKIWQISVSYDVAFGLDLEAISREKKCSIQNIIDMHTKPNYLIYFLGFQPGFLYLGGLDPLIHIPRKANPRLRVEKGSVGIGGEQTGVYPQDSAGGWNLIGKSPIDFFNIQKPQPCFAKAGDYIKFEAIDLETFHQISEEVNKGEYQPKFEWK